MTKCVAIMVLLCNLLMVDGLAQVSNGTSFPKAKVYLHDHKVLKVRQLKVTDAAVSFFDLMDNTNRSVAVDNVDFLKIPKGNHVLMGTSFGAATGALSSLLIDLDTDVLGRPREKDAGFYVAMTGGGAVLGALVGLLVPKWKSVYLNKKSARLHIPLQFDISPEMGVATLKITMKI